jgi:hypothetical protein
MPRLRVLWFAPILAFVFGILLSAAGLKPADFAARPANGTEARDAGEAFCPARPLFHGAVTIPNGRCYLIAVLRDTRGTFLALAPADAHIPAAKPVRLDTPAGPKLKRRLFLVPLATELALVPVNSLMLVPARIDDSGVRLNVVVLGTQAPNAPAATIDEGEH